LNGPFIILSFYWKREVPIPSFHCTLSFATGSPHIWSTVLEVVVYYLLLEVVIIGPSSLLQTCVDLLLLEVLIFCPFSQLETYLNLSIPEVLTCSPSSVLEVSVYYSLYWKSSYIVLPLYWKNIWKSSNLVLPQYWNWQFQEEVSNVHSSLSSL
jgi:hypothetical protein